MPIEVVATGTWVYGGTAESPAWIVRADFDSWYEIAAADGKLDPGEKPDLNADGVSDYVAFRQPSRVSFWPGGGRFSTREEAQRDAERRVPTPIQWSIG